MIGRPMFQAAKSLIAIPFKFFPNNSSNPTHDVTAFGTLPVRWGGDTSIVTINRTGTGVYLVQLRDRFAAILHANAQLVRDSSATTDSCAVGTYVQGSSANNSVTVTVRPDGAASDMAATTTTFVTGVIWAENLI